MNRITREWCEKNIELDPHEDYDFGSDQCYIDYPCVFPTVSFYLPCTDGLIELADEIRKENGYAPLTESECGWYNFYIGLNGFSDTRMDNCILFIVNDETADDDYADYQIDLDEEEQLAVYNRLNLLCKELYGKTCVDLLDEAKAYMD